MLPAVTGFCKWQVNALLRLTSTRGSPFYSRYEHSRTYFIRALTFGKVENWRDFRRSHKTGSNETKNNGWFGSVFEGRVRKLFSHCGRQRNTELLRLTSDDKKDQLHGS